MEHIVMWERLDGVGMQRLVLYTNSRLTTAGGLAIGLEDGKPFYTAYSVEYDPLGQLGRVQADAYSLVYQGGGRWQHRDGKPLPEFDGCTSIDIVETPFTNTLAIKQLRLQQGQSGEITVAWFHLAAGTWYPDRQRYTCLEKTNSGSTYRFEQLSSGYTATLPFDEQDLVIDYPDLYRRLYPKASDDR
jgi:hypothetical protein